MSAMMMFWLVRNIVHVILMHCMKLDRTLCRGMTVEIGKPGKEQLRAALMTISTVL